MTPQIESLMDDVEADANEAALQRRVEQAVAALRAKSRQRKQDEAVRLSENPPEFPYYALAVGAESHIAGCSTMKVAINLCDSLDKHGHFKEVVLCPSRRIVAPAVPK